MRRVALLAEAFAMLALASLLIAVLPFRTVAALSARGADRPATSAEARRIRQAVEAWARRVPWRAVCFQRGLAAQMMLRRRGLAAALYYGAHRDPQTGLNAHVWVRSHDVDVIGCHDLARYGVLAVFPPPR